MTTKPAVPSVPREFPAFMTTAPSTLEVLAALAIILTLPAALVDNPVLILRLPATSCAIPVSSLR